MTASYRFPTWLFGWLLSPLEQSLSSRPFMLDGIAVGEGGFESVEKLWHCVLALLATP